MAVVARTMAGAGAATTMQKILRTMTIWTPLKKRLVSTAGAPIAPESRLLAIHLAVLRLLPFPLGHAARAIPHVPRVPRLLRPLAA